MTTSLQELSLFFPKDKRLLNGRDFDAVFSDTNLRASSRFLLMLAKKNEAQKPRLGLVIAKKHIRLAVARNRVKRLIRESFRQQQRLGSIDVIVLARKGLDNLDNAQVQHQLQRLWLRINQIGA
ncbi:MAG: ribonuclease P protein component [Cellvibrionaceae bacterium]|jgi:ribonuclease P protein component